MAVVNPNVSKQLILPSQLKFLNHNPKGCELELALDLERSTDEASLQSSIFAQIQFACRYVEMFESRKVFRINFNLPKVDNLLVEQTLSALKQAPRMVRDLNVGEISVNIHNDLLWLELRPQLEMLTAEAAVHRIVLIPAFEIVTNNPGWRSNLRQCLMSIGPSSELSVVDTEFVLSNEDSDVIEEKLLGVIRETDAISKRVGLKVELNINVHVPRWRDDLWIFVLRTLLDVVETNITLLVRIIVDDSLEPGQVTRKGSLLSEMCWDVLLEFNRTQDWSALRAHLEEITTVQRREAF